MFQNFLLSECLGFQQRHWALIKMRPTSQPFASSPCHPEYVPILATVFLCHSAAEFLPATNNLINMTPLSHDWHPPIVELLQNISLLLTLTADSALEHVPVASFGRIKSN